MKRIFRNYPLAIILLLIIVCLSLGTPPQTGLEEVHGMDKIVHFGMYFTLTVVIWIEYLRHHDHPDWTKLVLFAFIAPVLFSGAMEVAQATLTVNRQGDWMDFLANSIGVIAGGAASWFCIRPLLWKDGN